MSKSLHNRRGKLGDKGVRGDLGGEDLDPRESGTASDGMHAPATGEHGHQVEHATLSELKTKWARKGFQKSRIKARVKNIRAGPAT